MSDAPKPDTSAQPVEEMRQRLQSCAWSDAARLLAALQDERDALAARLKRAEEALRDAVPSIQFALSGGSFESKPAQQVLDAARAALTPPPSQEKADE